MVVKTEYIVLKETVLTNNCPECYAQENLHLSFKQKKVFSKFSIKTDKDVISTIHCKHCNSDIYPEIWTEDIERVFDYHKKTVDTQSTIIKFTRLFYGLILLFVLILIGIIVYMTIPQFLDFLKN